MKKNKIKPILTSYNDDDEYRNIAEDRFNYTLLEEGENPTKWDIEKKYKNYCKVLFPETKLTKEVYEFYVDKIIGFQKLGRKLTSKEARDLDLLWRAVEANPERPPIYSKEWKLFMQKKSKKQVTS